MRTAIKQALLCALLLPLTAIGQINTDQVLRIGRNALYFEDYVLSIQYFNQVISAKPYLAQPYFYRGIAKFNLEDYKGAERDASTAIEHNPFITDAYELRGVARQNQGKLREAVSDYDKALEMMPEARGIIFNKALALEDLKEYGAADSAFATLLSHHPNFEGGYLGRAKLRMLQGDTVAAVNDIDRALDIDKTSVNAYVMRADIAINSNRDYQQALDDMNEAIRLQPRNSGFFINRAFLRHALDDYYGAMSDYDYALQLDPNNYMALFNRALLRAEVHDYNSSIDDLNSVLAMRPNDYRAIYNRAIVYKSKGEHKRALADVNRVIEAFPDLAAAYFLRFDIKREMNDRTAEADYNRSLALAKERIRSHPDDESVGAMALIERSDNPSGTIDGDDEGEPQEVVAARFTRLLTVADNSQVEQEYNNRNIRGRVQDRNSQIEIEPMFVLTYYSSPTELKPGSDYIREVDDLNRSRALNFVIQVTNHESTLDDPDAINRHFESIAYYNSYMGSHTPRAVDYFGRAMDQMTVHNFAAAVEDLTRAIDAAPDFTLAYFMRAVARYRAYLASVAENDGTDQGKGGLARKTNVTMQGMLNDINRVIELSPEMPIAWYNKGVILAMLHDYTSALAAFNRAVELKPDFGEGYYNRGFVYFHLGNRSAGAADLSRAGELGVVPSYNLLKRMSN